jgi:anti-sigma factor ChrR (cupin superfamily)
LNTHEQYEELCALAASGQASEAELEDLRSHLDGCPSCRSAAYDFTQISARGLAQVAARRLHCNIPSGMKQRFVARARSEGIEMRREHVVQVAKPKRVTEWMALGAVAALALVAGLLAIGRNRAPIAATPHPDGAASITTTPRALPQDQNESTELRQKLDSAHSEMASLRSEIREQRSQLEATGTTQSSLTAQLSAAEQDAAKIRVEKAQLEARIAGLEADMAKARTDKGTSDAVVALQETELRNLRSKLADQNAALNQQEEVAARGSDVRDLVIARNLHIIDVHDRDGDGKSQRAFGRIFYTEGKSLIFYAYDLADPRKLDAKVSFYVWGERLGTEKPIKSLGVFHTDDASDGRWVLTFDDPQVLAQINSVFVTVEAVKKSTKEPGGKRILFAFLGDKPNHP